jgi:cytochrome d ubiquinol oxidase subunit II
VSRVIGAVLFAVVMLYAVFGGADFGAGFWDLTAGGAERGERPRGLVDHSIGPVWEANHVWLVFCLVVLWTAFPSAFAGIMTTLFVPLGLAGLGIVLRGAGFAFRKVAVGTGEQRATGAAFAISSVVTPFFFGTVAGGIASGRVPAGTGGGDGVTSWVNPTSMLGGVLAVAVCAFLAAVFLTAEARARELRDLETYFRRRAVAAGAAAGLIAGAGVFVLRADAHRLFDRLVGPALPLVLVSGAAGVATLVLLGRVSPARLRSLAVLAVAAVVAGWGVGQYPYLLGTHLTLAEGAAPPATLWAVLVVFAAATTLIAPSLVLLYTLQERGRLEGV